MAALTKSLAKEYSLLYESCLIRPKRKAAVDQVIRRLASNRPRYEKVAKALIFMPLAISFVGAWMPQVAQN